MHGIPVLHIKMFIVIPLKYLTMILLSYIYTMSLFQESQLYSKRLSRQRNSTHCNQNINIKWLEFEFESESSLSASPYSFYRPSSLSSFPSLPLSFSSSATSSHSQILQKFTPPCFKKGAAAGLCLLC